MALIRCPQCGNPVSDKAPACPRCGHPIAQAAPLSSNSEQSGGNKMGWLYAVIGLLGLLTLVLIIVMFTGGRCSRSTSQTTTPTQASEAVSATSAAPVAPAPAEQVEEAKPAVDLSHDGTYHLSGKVAGQRCKMDLTIDGSNVYGSYSYNKFGKPLQLSGTRSGSTIFLSEVDDDGENSGELNGRISGNSFTGTHTRYKTMADTHFSFTAD